MTWTLTTGSLVEQVRAYLTGITDGHTRRQTSAWVRAWDQLAPELEAALTELAMQAVDGRVSRADVIRSVRLQQALEQTVQTLSGLIDGSATEIIDRLLDVVDHAGAMQARIIASELPPAGRNLVAGWSRSEPFALDAIVTRTTEQITKLSYPIAPDAAMVMRAELVRGIAVGANPRAVAARMVTNTETVFNGGLNRALTIARTEMLDAHRTAARMADQANAELLNGWVWTSTLSPRTCQACFGMHGTLFPLDQPGPEGHQNCRCTRVPKTKSWRELGFDIDEPEDLTPDAAAVFDAFSPEDQLRILGPARFEAWQAGDYPISDWATKRTNPGWRDSWVPSAAPAA